VTTDSSLYLVRGDDPSIVGQEVHALLHSVVGERDPATVVEEHGALGGDDLDVGSVVDALTTPPFLTDMRVVVVREAGRLSAADAKRIVEALETAAPGVILVVVSGGGTVPAALVKAAQAKGVLVEASAGTGRARTQWVANRLRHAPVRLDARAGALLSDHLGEDVGRLGGLLDTLASAYGPGSSIDPDRLEPFLGEAGSVAPWELTDAIAEGDTAEALTVLNRLSGPGGLHPLAVLGLLHRHYQSMLRLDGSDATSGEEAAALIGARSVFPAKKALEQGRRLGSARLGRAVILLAEADLDLRGRSALPDRTTLEVLVGRLSRLGSVRSAGGTQRSGARRPTRARRR
jgi:DNA polymerase III subunit delta